MVLCCLVSCVWKRAASIGSKQQASQVAESEAKSVVTQTEVGGLKVL